MVSELGVDFEKMIGEFPDLERSLIIEFLRRLLVVNTIKIDEKSLQNGEEPFAKLNEIETVFWHIRQVCQRSGKEQEWFHAAGVLLADSFRERIKKLCLDGSSGEKVWFVKEDGQIVEGYCPLHDPENWVKENRHRGTVTVHGEKDVFIIP